MTGRVLLVDDNPVQLLVMAALLRQAGYEVQEARDGADALEELGKGDLPDLVLCDIGMPRMNGITVCHRIRGTPAWQHLPVVILTELGSDRNETAAIEAGADDFLLKPLDREDIEVRLATALARSRRRHGEFGWHQAVLDSVPLAVAVTDADHHYVYGNAAALALLGYAKADLLRLSTHEEGLDPPPWAGTTHLPWHGRSFIRTSAGERRPVDVICTTAKAGGATYYVLTLHATHA